MGFCVMVMGVTLCRNKLALRKIPRMCIEAQESSYQNPRNLHAQSQYCSFYKTDRWDHSVHTVRKISRISSKVTCVSKSWL